LTSQFPNLCEHAKGEEYPRHTKRSEKKEIERVVKEEAEEAGGRGE
jgi:hypothetical protein